MSIDNLTSASAEQSLPESANRESPGLRSGTAPTGIAYTATHASVYAGFGDRLIAWSIDWVVLLVLRFAILLLWSTFAVTVDSLGVTSKNLSLTGGIVIFLSLYLIAWIYYAALESSRSQATLGKIAMRLRVTDLDHKCPTFLQASLRFFFRIVSVLSMGLGFLCILTTQRKQALHDLGANCLVLRRGR